MLRGKKRWTGRSEDSSEEDVDNFERDRGGVGRGGRTRTIARQDDANSGRKAGVIHTAAARESIAR